MGSPILEQWNGLSSKQKAGRLACMCGGLYIDLLLLPPPHHPTPSCMLRFIGYYGRWVREVEGWPASIYFSFYFV